MATFIEIEEISKQWERNGNTVEVQKNDQPGNN